MNRAFLYGDGFFETIYVHGEEIPLFDRHLKRARASADILHLKWPQSLTDEYLSSEIREQVKLKKLNEARCRISFYRKGGGYYIPESNDMECRFILDEFVCPEFALGVIPTIQANSLEDLTECCERLPPAKVVVYDANVKSKDPFSGVKSLSAQFYVQAGVFVKSKDAEEGIILNRDRRVAELLLGNVLVVKNKQWYTPPSDEGGIVGVMISELLDKFKKITLTPLSTAHLSDADILIGCNALRGLYRLK
jgi:branched-chain amino acid aminotransferase